jgi:hypothetical protein
MRPALANPVDANFFFSNVVVTNLDKVGTRKDILDGPLRKIHDRYYTLTEEIEVLKPRLIWFPTESDYDGYLLRALPGISFRDVGGGVRQVEGLPGLAYRTYHP